MSPVGVEGSGVPIGSFVLWMLIDFPISWVIIGFGIPNDTVLKIALLVGGG